MRSELSQSNKALSPFPNSIFSSPPELHRGLFNSQREKTLFLRLMLKESCLFSSKQMSDTYSDWLVGMTSINISGPWRFLSHHLISHVQREDMSALSWPTCRTLTQPVHLQQGRGRKTRNTHRLIRAAVGSTKDWNSCARASFSFF